MIIDKFTGKYKFLSNFYLIPIEYEGVIYRSVEHAFQAAKTLDSKQRNIFRQCVTPADAKYCGRLIKLRDDWENVKDDIMYELVKQKFNNIELKDKLVATGNNLIIEGNNHGDCYWGVCNNVGENHLGRILMRVRNEIKIERQ